MLFFVRTPVNEKGINTHEFLNNRRICNAIGSITRSMIFYAKSHIFYSELYIESTSTSGGHSY